MCVFLFCAGSGDELFVLSLKWLKEKMLSSAMRVRIMPMLLINGGLPSSSKTTALKKLLKKIGPLKLNSMGEDDGVAFCYMLAARNLCENKIVYVPPVRDKGYPTVLYAGVENMIRSSFGKQLKNATIFPSDESSQFSNQDLNKHFTFVTKNLWDEINNAKHRDFAEWDRSHTCGIALINIWDLGLNKVPNHVLSHLAGHLYNSHVWMFLDLQRDVDHLYEVPDIPDNRYDKSRNDKELIMRWRSRIRYFLRFAELASMKNGSRQSVCNIIASFKKSEKFEESMIKLKEAVERVSKQLKLQDLIDTENIETFDTEDIEPLYELFTKSIRAGLDNAIDVPLSFIFLRSLFFEKDQLYIKKDELKEMSKELSIDDENFKWFCRLFTSFGSIIDVSLIEPTSNLVLLRTTKFLNTFDKLFYYSPHGTIVTSHGLVSIATSGYIFGSDTHVFMSFLKSLRIATEISPKQVNIPTEGCSYYVPNICTSPPLLQCSPTSLHLVHDMNISLKHFQVLFTAKFLNSYPEAQLNVTMIPHINITRFCLPSVNLLFELIYHGDIIEFRFPPDLTEDLLHNVCECIVIICRDIMDGSDILYNFAIMCPNDVTLQSSCKLQTSRHVLPFNKTGKECSSKISCQDGARIEVFNCMVKKVCSECYFFRLSKFFLSSIKLTRIKYSMEVVHTCYIIIK